MIDKELDNLNLKKLFEDQKKFLEENKDSEGTWKSVRSTENFNVINQIFPWGARNIAVPKEKKNNYFLQRSRSYELGNTESVHLGTFYDLTKLKGHQKVLDDGGYNCPADAEAADAESAPVTAPESPG